jgi:transcription antitermination factor NusG
MNNINDKQWYAVYTKSRAEKKALLELEIQGVECYLPLHRKLRQWSDRKKWIEVPLISGYLFVHISLKEYDLVLRTNNVVTYVRFEGKAAIIPDREIESIQHLLRQKDVALEVSNQVFSKGDKIEVIAGPLMGMRGKLVTIKGKKKVAIEIEQLNLSLVVEVPINEISKI